jgi:hypothetical protein
MISHEEFKLAVAGKVAWSVRALTISIFLVVLTAPGARAQSCYEKCQDSCKDMSGHVNSACVDTCFRAYCNKSSNNQPRPYGSVAFALVSAGEGISWGKATQAEADRAALARCGKYSKNCRIVFQFHNTCAALAVAKGAQHYLAATADTEKKASAIATQQCRQNWGICLVDMSACSP